MAITGISAISGEQIIAAGAVSAREAASAAFTTGGNNLQGLYDTVSSNSATWGQGGGGALPQSASDAIDVVTGGSADWNSAASTVFAGYTLWNASYGTLNLNSAHWNSTYTTVSNNSGSWTGGSTYTGDAQGALDEIYMNSADWNSTTATVSTNSGAWGGSALPISAGPGIKFEIINDTLIASTDETVLFFAGNDSSGVQAGNLTESIKNFERIRVAGMDNDGHVDIKYIYPAWTKNADNANATGYEVMLYGANPINNTVWEKWTRYSFSALTSFNVVLSYEGSYTANTISDVTNSHKNSVREVIGINRIAGGN